MAASSSNMDEVIELSSFRPADIVAPYFNYNKDSNISRCLIPGCSVTMKGRHTSNLEKHIHRNHPSESAIIAAKRELLKRRRSQSGSDSSAETSHDEDDSGTKRTIPKKKRKVCVIEMDADTILDACIDLVTVDGRPFSIFEDREFKKLFGPLIKNVPNLTINRHTIQRHVAQEAESLRVAIRREVEGRLVSVKIDTATRLHHSVLGVNIQFCKEGRIVVRNLAVRELLVRHSAECLKNEVLLVLNAFGISCDNIYSVTTDNAANMLKTIRLLDEEVAYHSTASSEEEEGMATAAGESECFTVTNIEEDDDSNMIFLRSYMGDKNIFTQRCAAHTLQLAVQDALRQSNVEEVINKVRLICRQLRTPAINSILQRMGKSKPTLDVATRWHSTLDMVESFLKFQEICKEQHEISARCQERADLNISEQEHRQLLFIKEALTPAKVVTKRLEKEELNVGEFVQLWMRCKIQTQEVPSSLAQALVIALDTRGKYILETPAVACGLFMDPRCHVLLSKDERATAIQYLEHTWHRIQNVKASRFGPQAHTSEPIARSASYQQMPPPVAPNAAGNSTSMQSEPEDPVQAFLQRRRLEMIAEIQSPQRPQIKNILEGVTRNILSLKEFQPREESPILYWELKKFAHSELYELAMVVLAVPVTQVSVERICSNLKFILSYLRMRMHSRTIEDVLFVRCNRNFINK